MCNAWFVRGQRYGIIPTSIYPTTTCVPRYSRGINIVRKGPSCEHVPGNFKGASTTGILWIRAYFEYLSTIYRLLVSFHSILRPFPVARFDRQARSTNSSGKRRHYNTVKGYIPFFCDMHVVQHCSKSTSSRSQPLLL